MNIKARCNNPKNTAYLYYGEKGIKLCDEWMQFQVFKDWALSNGYGDGLTIDRIDPEEWYRPENCRWISQSENTRMAHLGKRHKRRKAV